MIKPKQEQRYRDIQALQERADRLEALRKCYQPHKAQERILEALKAGCKKIFVRAGRQSGKTQECCDLSWLRAGLVPGSVCSIITPERKQAKKIYWKKGTIQRFGPSSWVEKCDNEDLTVFFKNGSYIELDGSDNIDSHRGDKKDFVVLDEYKDIDPRFYTEVIEPMFLTTGGIVVIIGTPPETPESHFKQLEDHAMEDPTWEVVTWTSYDSPYTDNDWLDRKREELAKRGEEDVFKREYLAEYTVGGKNSVFPMFSRRLHMKSPEVVHRYFTQNRNRFELYWVSDPATSSVFASLFIAYWREKGQILVLDEIYEKDKQKTHTGAIVDTALAKIAPFEPDIKKWSVVYDDHEAWFGQELLHGHKIASYPAGKQAVEKEEGIALMKSLLLQRNTVVLSRLCHHFATEMENYVMIRRGEGVVYPKANDHLIDDFRYFQTFAHVVLSLGEGGELDEDAEELYDFYLERLYDDTGLPGFIQ